MKKLTSSVYTFADLIADDSLYVDKTEFIWKLVSRGKGLYFLSRPRRFGKSLTLSTLKAVFEGRRELFEGLAIAKKDYGWKPYPVIHLNLGNCDARTPEDLRKYLAHVLRQVCSDHGLAEDADPSQLAASFEGIIRAVAKDVPAVILVDEYDKPILNVLGAKRPQVLACLDVLRGLYSSIKACEPLERFVLVTGISKFSHVSMFSELNNLTDLSMHPDFATMLGYTQEELEAAFDEHIADATRRGLERDQLLADLKEWYDGYRFHHAAAPVYNPVSVARFFDEGCELRNFWFSTGTPTFLLTLMRKRDFCVEDALGRPVSDEAFSAFEVDRIDPLVLLYQTGYLTILSAERRGTRVRYRLGFPNQEVALSFSSHLVRHYTGASETGLTSFQDTILDALDACDMPLLRTALDAFLAGIPYDLHLKTENNFHNVIFAVLRLVGADVAAEQRTSSARADAVCKTRDWIYILEFKLDGDTSALAQIRDRRYYAPYLADPRRIMLVGVAFDTAKGTIADWQHEELDRTRLDATPSPADSNGTPCIQETK